MSTFPSSAYPKTFALLCRCARTQLSASQAKHIRQLLEEGVEWDELLALALFHGVQPLLKKSLMEVGPDQIPEAIRQQLQRDAHARAAYCVFLADELGRLLKSLDAGGLPAIAFKGPILAQVAYGDIGLRPYIDLDILVRSADYEAVTALLKEEGYTPHEKVLGLKGLQKKLYLWQTRQCPFRRGESVFTVDLHIDVMPPLYSYAVDFETLWQRAEVISIGGVRARSFAAEDLLQILCYHGAKNRWEALKHVCDVAELIRAKPEMNWEAVFQRARRTHGERILYLGIYLAHTLLETPLPPDVASRLVLPRPVQRVASRLLERLPEQMHRGIAGFGERFRFHLAIQDTLGTKARYGCIALLRRCWGLFHHNVEPV